MADFEEVVVVLVAVVVPFVTWIPATSVRAKLFRTAAAEHGAVNTIRIYFRLTSSSVVAFRITSMVPTFELSGMISSLNCAFPILSVLTKQTSVILVSNDAENDIVLSNVVNNIGTPLTLTDSVPFDGDVDVDVLVLVHVDVVVVVDVDVDVLTGGVVANGVVIVVSSSSQSPQSTGHVDRTVLPINTLSQKLTV